MILFCRCFIPTDSYKRTSPRGPEAKHLRPRRTTMHGVYAAGRLSFTKSRSANVCTRCCRTFIVGNTYASLTCRCSKCAISMDEIFHAGLEPLRAFFCSYPMDGILRASRQRCGPMDGILSDTLRALMDQTELCCKKPRSSQHHPCFRAMINLQSRIRRPRCYSQRADGTRVALTADSKRHALLSALVWPFSELRRSPFHKDPSPSCSILTFGSPSFAYHPCAFFSSRDYSTAIFGRLQHSLSFGRLLSQPSHFLWLFIFLGPYSPLQI